MWTIRSGALLAVYVSRITENDESFKTNISAVFIVDNGFRIILYKTLALLTLSTVKSVLLLIPFALFGLFTGMKCCGLLNEKKCAEDHYCFVDSVGLSCYLLKCKS